MQAASPAACTRLERIMVAVAHRARRLVWVGLALVLGFVVSACSRRTVEKPEAFSWTDQLPSGSSLHIRNGAGEITVLPADDSILRVVGGKRWRRGRERDIQFQVTRRGDANDVYVCAMWRASGRCAETGYRGKRTDTFLSHFSLFSRTTDATASLVVHVPPGIAVDAKTTNGTVTIRGVHAGVTARSVVGSITALGVGGGGPVTLATTSGSIRLRVDSLSGTDTIEATTVNGAVNASLPPNVEGTFDLSTVSGRVRSEFPLSVSHGRRFNTAGGQIGSALRLIKFHTVNGSVAVVKTASSDSGYISPDRLP
jgi:hypothetical protein